jgi:hypothetical protein
MLGRGKKPQWSPELDDLPGDEKVAAMSAILFLKLSGRHLKKAKILPEKDPLAFEALVARIAAPFVGKAEEQSPREIYEIAHCLRDGATVLSPGQLSRGPYGDLFYRVDQGCSVVVHTMWAQRGGGELQINPADTVEPPHLADFLDAMASRFADALLKRPTGTWQPMRFTETLLRLSSESSEDPPLIAALRAKQPFAEVAHGPGWELSEDDLLDMTRDPELAHAVATTPAV